MKTFILALSIIGIIWSASVSEAQPDPCIRNVTEVAETLATLNDLNPHKGNTTVEKTQNGYSVTTVNADATRSGSFTVRLANFGSCRISAISDDDAQ